MALSVRTITGVTLLLVMLLLLLQVGSFVSPWYHISAHNWPKVGETRSFYLWWRGFHYDITQIRPGEASHSDDEKLHHPPIEVHQKGMLRWEDLKSPRLKDLYLSSVMLVLLSTMFTFALLFVAAVLRITIEGGDNVPGTAHVAVHFITGSLLLSLAASWLIFMNFMPPLLAQASLCSDEKDKWCTSFAGTSTTPVEGVPDEEVSLAWYPFVGWMCAFISTFPAAMIVFLMHILMRKAGTPQTTEGDEPLKGEYAKVINM